MLRDCHHPKGRVRRGSPDPAETSDRRSPGEWETFGRQCGSVGRPATTGRQCGSVGRPATTRPSPPAPLPKGEGRKAPCHPLKGAGNCMRRRGMEMRRKWSGMFEMVRIMGRPKQVELVYPEELSLRYSPCFRGCHSLVRSIPSTPMVAKMAEIIQEIDIVWHAHGGTKVALSALSGGGVARESKCGKKRPIFSP